MAADEKTSAPDPRRPEPTPDLPPLPVEPKARRRALAVRGW